MKYTSRYFNAEGIVTLAPKQGKKQKPKDVTKKNKEKEICLNCNNSKCNGNCKKAKRKQEKQQWE